MPKDVGKLIVTVEMCPWLQEALFAAVELMQEVEKADDVLVTDEIHEKAATFREKIEGRTRMVEMRAVGADAWTAWPEESHHRGGRRFTSEELGDIVAHHNYAYAGRYEYRLTPA